MKDRGPENEYHMTVINTCFKNHVTLILWLSLKISLDFAWTLSNLTCPGRDILHWYGRMLDYTQCEKIENCQKAMKISIGQNSERDYTGFYC